MNDAEQRAKALFTALLRQRMEGVNFSIAELGNSWEIVGVSLYDSLSLRRFSAVIYKSDERYFLLQISVSGFNQKTMKVSLDADVNEQAAWIASWLRNEMPS